MEGLELTDDTPIPLMEELGAQSHAIWSEWSTYELDTILNEMLMSPLGAEIHSDLLDMFVALDCVRRWRRQAATPYENLSEKEKESDRKEVRKQWWLFAKSCMETETDCLVAGWVREVQGVLTDRLRVQEECCRDVCPMCRGEIEGYDPAARGNDGWFHAGDGPRQRCFAGGIRDRIAVESGEEG